jgi:glycosyltransferase involved in cell wall biosynthesis
MLNEAESGVFIPPNSTNAIIDAIRFYVEMDVNERNMIGLKGRHWIVDNYSNDVVCNRYLERLCALVTDKQ